MKFFLPLLTLAMLLATIALPAQEASGDYTIVIEGYDWGAAASRVILPLAAPAKMIDKANYSVAAKRSLKGKMLGEGRRGIVYAYPSDEHGQKQEAGNYATLVLRVGPDEYIGSPIQYVDGSNIWINYELTVTDIERSHVWNKETDRRMPQVDRFDLSGTFSHEGTKLTYASYVPETAEGKRPLIIWLHGGGEGGTDPSIPLLANKASNYAAPDIQYIFGGAHVLVPQTQGAWMHNDAGVSTRGKDDDIYNQALLALIKDYVGNHPGIDAERIYLGGCSNGGYMTLKLMMLAPDLFAATFPSASAYNSEYISDEDIEKIKHIPTWFIHSMDDPVTPAAATAIPTYERMKAAGAKNLHFSLYDHVVDITGFFGGDDYHYLGHFSWIYSHANSCRLDYDGSPVVMNGKPVTIMEWLAGQRLR